MDSALRLRRKRYIVGMENLTTTAVSAASEVSREWTRSEILLNAWLDRAAELVEQYVVTPFIGAPGVNKEEVAE